jgi:hypothetical protein
MERCGRPLTSLKIFGGSGSDSGDAVAVDADGNVYVAGATQSTDFPVAGALQTSLRGVPLRSSADGGKNWTAASIAEPLYAVVASAKAPATIYAGTTSLGAQLDPTGRLATTLAGTTVTFDGVPAPLISVGEQRVVCVVPFGAAHRPATRVQVHSAGSDSNAILLPTAHPADRGPSSRRAQAAGERNRREGWDRDADVLYIGPAAGQLAGTTQINLRLPQLAPGSYTAYVGWGASFHGRPLGADYGIPIVAGQL